MTAGGLRRFGKLGQFLAQLNMKQHRAGCYAVPPCKNEDAELAGSTSEHGGVSDALTTLHLLAISPDGQVPQRA